MGYTRKDRMMNGMWSKSSKRYADRMERNVIILGLALGASLLSAFSSIKVPSAFPPSVSNLTSTQQKDTVKSSRRLCIVLLFFAPILQVLGYVSFAYWGWWAFFSLLVFSSLSLLFLGVAGTEASFLGQFRIDVYKRILVFVIIEAFLYFISNLWPVYVWDDDVTAFSYILMSCQSILSITLIYYSWKEYKDRIKNIELTTNHPETEEDNTLQ